MLIVREIFFKLIVENFPPNGMRRRCEGGSDDAFYTDILGLEFVAQVPKENPHFVFLKSGADYVLLGRDTSRGRFSDIIHHAFMVDGDAYDATVAELKAKGVDVFREDQRDEGIFTGRSAYFHDPDNNALEIIHLTNRAKG